MLYSVVLILFSCNSPELGPAPASDKCTHNVPASSILHTAGADCCAAGNISAITGYQCTGQWCSGDLSQHHYLSVQHICGSTSDSRTVHQPCHCKAQRDLLQFTQLFIIYNFPVLCKHVAVLCSDQCGFFGSASPVPQFPYVHSHHQQRHVGHGWYHQPDHHKCPGTGRAMKSR